ncbi:SDR family NAD(P)-dependent oxidoreductase [Pseudofrancisella aestuarii]|uniref:SDR family NAD(P)-dependent oxidoreductase n=1 Tax=Pseudofrancisella aestuarii TaxID=2670347 RepID=A0ABV9T956_9GAMM|nr:SDR family oxidoreductase [Pseudofrancisella aestuarii]
MKNYLITGGSKGIGKAVIELLLKSKENFIINLDIVAPDIENSNLKFIKTNLENKDSIIHAVEELKDVHFIGLFLNAGIHINGSLFTSNLDDVQKVINVNVMANIYLLKYLRPNLEHGCSIVFNGSDQCFVAKISSFAYGLTKGAVAQMTKSLALDLAKYDIRVNAICPGTVDTELYRQAINNYAKKNNISMEEMEKLEAEEFPMKRIAKPEEIANLVEFLLSKKSSFMTGSLLPIDGGYTAK